jgi:predicted transposase YdaD
LKSFRDKVQKLKISEIRSDVMTLAEQLIQEGRLEGRQEGRQEGERLLLERQLIRRFGALPDWVSRKLEEATTDQLEQWGEAILDAPSLESVFRE